MPTPAPRTQEPQLTPMIVWGSVALVAALLPMIYLASGVAFQVAPSLTEWPWAQTWIAIGAALGAAALGWTWRARFDPRLRAAVAAATGMAVVSTGIHVVYVTTLSRQLPPAEAARVDVGQLAPEIEVTGSDGQRFRLSDHRGQRVALVFYRGTW